MLTQGAIAFAWSHRVGEWRHDEKEPIKMKKHGRLAKSLFRHGLDFIREILFFGKFSIAQFRQCLSQLVPLISSAQGTKTKAVVL